MRACRDTLEQVVKMGFDRNVVVDSIHTRVHNKATVAYYLMGAQPRELRAPPLWGRGLSGLRVHEVAGTPV